MKEPTHELHEEVATLLAFLARQPLTAAVAGLEQALNGADATRASAAAQRFGVDPQVLTAAIRTRRELGRVNDLIHACAISLVLSTLLEPGETVLGAPSLAAGNDPRRPFDLETNRRVAEFKLSHWKGADAMRKRGVFHDLVHLAADKTHRKKQLFVVGPAPAKFLRTSTSSALWGLDKSTSTRTLFEREFGSLSMPIREFTAGPVRASRSSTSWRCSPCSTLRASAEQGEP